MSLNLGIPAQPLLHTISTAHNQRLSTQRGAGLKTFRSDIYLPILTWSPLLCPSSTFSHTVYLAETHSNSSYIPRSQGGCARLKALGPGLPAMSKLHCVPSQPALLTFLHITPLLPFIYRQKPVSVDLERWGQIYIAPPASSSQIQIQIGWMSSNLHIPAYTSLPVVCHFPPRGFKVLRVIFTCQQSRVLLCPTHLNSSYIPSHSLWNLLTCIIQPVWEPSQYCSGLYYLIVINVKQKWGCVQLTP